MRVYCSSGAEIRPRFRLGVTLWRWLFAAVGLCLAQSALAQIGPLEKWDPAGRAASTLGEITFSPSRITFASGKSLPLVHAGSMPFATDMGITVTAEIYRVLKPEALPPYEGNQLCDGKRVTFLLIWRDARFGEMRQLEPFSGNRFKVGSPDDCGRFAFDLLK